MTSGQLGESRLPPFPKGDAILPKCKPWAQKKIRKKSGSRSACAPAHLAVLGRIGVEPGPPSLSSGE